jgi:hypothetical protein
VVIFTTFYVFHILHPLQWSIKCTQDTKHVMTCPKIGPEKWMGNEHELNNMKYKKHIQFSSKFWSWHILT